jgi:hypothetical protein
LAKGALDCRADNFEPLAVKILHRARQQSKRLFGVSAHLNPDKAVRLARYSAAANRKA